ncbi:hypothetical protein OIU83_15225 [Flavobacterium sp. LS1R49]|uniref:LysM domain-containing protein n=1 Tax=Flavobacterium shii TaxID=2987687 RepID=A0A9X2ZHX2_9FLAO|nr:hypothetical protein [Flavobacterium shii]MCV9929016.1 hypothetical protein [Flavobacterium shii]
MDNFKKYKVQRGDTIEAIAIKIGIPAAEVRSYHNRYCELCDLVELGLPIRKIEYILLPNLESFIETKLSEKNTVKKVLLGANNNLRLTAMNGLKREYGTTIFYKNNDQLINKIHFTAQIEFVKKENDFSIVKFEINQVYVNSKEPEMVIEQLADKISKALYPLLMSLKRNGEIREILNIKEIQERWEKLKPSILKFYKGGDIIIKLLSSFEKSIESATLLRKNLVEHPFYKIYFSPIYQNYSPDLLFIDNDFQFKIFQNVDEFQSLTAKFHVNRKGIINSDRKPSKELLSREQVLDDIKGNREVELKDTVFEAGKLEDGISGNMDFQYKLHYDSKTIFSITGFINSRKDKETVSTIEFETYEIGLKKQKINILNPISDQIDWSSEIINVKEIKEQGFWDKFW